jgi:hypothetical protein
VTRHPAGFWLGLALGALLAGGAGALLMRTTAPTTASPTPAPPPSPERSPRPPPARGSSSSGPEASGSETASATTTDPTRPRGAGDVASGTSSHAGGPEPADADARAEADARLREALTREPGAARIPRKPEARGQWLEDNVMLLLTSVAPELDGAQVTRECTPDGSVCTIEGPWPGDDFLGRWLDAISDDVIAPGDLSGVTFSRFENTDGDAGPGFRITAHTPPR